MDKIKALRLLEAERANQAERIELIKEMLQQLCEKEQQLEKQLCQVKNQEERLLHAVTKELNILDQINENIDALEIDNMRFGMNI